MRNEESADRWLFIFDRKYLGGQVAGQQIGLVSKDDMKGFIDGVF